MASASIEYGSPLGVMTAAMTKMTTMAIAPLLHQRLRREHADELQEHQQHGELERDAERGDHQPDEADVLADLEVGLRRRRLPSEMRKSSAGVSVEVRDDARRA